MNVIEKKSFTRLAQRIFQMHDLDFLDYFLLFTWSIHTHRCYHNILPQFICGLQDDFDVHSQNCSVWPLCSHLLSQFLLFFSIIFEWKKTQILFTLYTGLHPTEYKVIAVFTYTASAAAVIKTITVQWEFILCNIFGHILPFSSWRNILPFDVDN